MSGQNCEGGANIVYYFIPFHIFSKCIKFCTYEASCTKIFFFQVFFPHSPQGWNIVFALKK